ncbi:hypothetical protein [Enhygromyxa salina]|uniref:Uncharacterized protein n=1 Tax=Enhygromyxa salina TaxID=215803 RepID=A0A2S9YC53_9BACT|nr:hypothetical protein [Enhygromyxa salina]PRQ02708.1 hypothetical protein ENSA7_55370 [Enhygromyxa salina]
MWWLGGKTELMFETSIASHVDEDALTQMIEVLRRHFADPGRLEERMPNDAHGTVAIRTFIAGFSGFMSIIPLKPLVAKWLLLTLLGPMTATGALIGWLIGRAVWRWRSDGREQQLRGAFSELVGHASTPAPVLGPASSE